MTTDGEQVLVLPTKTLWDRIPYFQGARTLGMAETVHPEQLFRDAEYRPRDAVESDPTFKQLIPYCLLYWHNSPAVDILTYQRSKSGSESRLHGSISVGIGGHVNPTDTVAGEFWLDIQRAAVREIMEEVDITPLRGFTGLTPVGYINDDDTDVGRVHFGILFSVYLQDGTEVTPQDPEIGELARESLSAVLEKMHNQPDIFESWSRLGLPAFSDMLRMPEEGLPAATAQERLADV